MVMRRWDPLREIHRIEENMNRLWRGILPGVEAPSQENWGIPLDVVEEGENVVVHASLPGVEPGAIEVSVENDVLTIRGDTRTEQEHRSGDYLMRERRAGSFYRTLRLPDTVDTDKAKSVFKRGVLSITFPKREDKRPKQLTIEVQDQDETKG